MNRLSIRVAGATVALCVTSFAPLKAQTTFEQLNWLGLNSSTFDSDWGRVTLDFTGFANRRYFNLVVNGTWVVRNMGVDSLFGAGVPQTVTTTFDLGVPSGTDVASLNFVSDISVLPLPSMPLGTPSNAPVTDLDYQIGAEGGVDLGGPGSPEAPAGGNAATVTSSAKLPMLDMFDNQVQGTNQCAPGAISNSLKYLQATGSLAMTVKTDITDIGGIIGTDADGTRANWPMTKRDHFKGTLKTEFLDDDDIDGLIAAVNAGKDVELDLAGHVAVVVGVRKYSDGRVELDIMDDNQTDNAKDKVRTVEIKNGKVDGMDIDRFVVETAEPAQGVPDPQCQPIPNSTGQPGVVELTGDGAAGEVIAGTVVNGPPGGFGYFITGPNSGIIGMVPGSQGILCIAPPQFRYSSVPENQLFQFDDSGISRTVFNGGASVLPTDGSYGPVPPVFAGETRVFQAWYRDHPTSNFTDSKQVTFQ